MLEEAENRGNEPIGGIIDTKFCAQKMGGLDATAAAGGRAGNWGTSGCAGVEELFDRGKEAAPRGINDDIELPIRLVGF